MKFFPISISGNKVIFFIIIIILLVVSVTLLYNPFNRVSSREFVDSLEQPIIVESIAAPSEPDNFPLSPSSPLNKESQNQVKIAFIIDDFGDNGEGTEEMMSINRPMTFAIIPFLKYTQRDAVTAHEKGHEVIVHLPMETRKGSSIGLGSGAIRTSQTDSEIEDLVQSAIKNVPYAIGANNHMGVLASTDERVVKSVINVLKENGLYAVDSKTTPKSIIYKVARYNDVPVLEMSLFIDNEKNKESIKKYIRQLSYVAIKRGYAIGIGHVGPLGGSNTAQAIKEMIPELESKGIKIVSISELIRDKYDINE